MPNTADHHGIAGNSIADDVGTDAGQFAHIRAAHWTATMREIDEAVSGCKQRLGHMRRRLGIKVKNIIMSAPDPPQGGSSPDNAHRLGFGRRNSFAPAQFRQPFADALMRHDPPSRFIGFGFRIKASLGSRIGWQIKDRLGIRVSHAHLS
jgi:hypothetical protein